MSALIGNAGSGTRLEFTHMSHDYRIDRSPHPTFFVVSLQSLHARRHRRIFLRLGFLGPATGEIDAVEQEGDVSMNQNGSHVLEAKNRERIALPYQRG
jgi:hypothetical protein